jgi:TIR domain
MAKVFLSYAPADAGSARQIASALRDAGHSVKLGRASIDIVDAGGRLAASVFALKHSDVVVVALSPNAIKSAAIVDELMLAEQTYKPVIPLFLESVKLPPAVAKPLRYVRKIYCTDSLAAGVSGLLRTLAKGSNPLTR